VRPVYQPVLAAGASPTPAGEAVRADDIRAIRKITETASTLLVRAAAAQGAERRLFVEQARVRLGVAEEQIARQQIEGRADDQTIEG